MEVHPIQKMGMSHFDANGHESKLLSGNTWFLSLLTLQPENRAKKLIRHFALLCRPSI